MGFVQMSEVLHKLGGRGAKMTFVMLLTVLLAATTKPHVWTCDAPESLSLFLKSCKQATTAKPR